MTQEPQAIEVEVVEIDGAAPPAVVHPRYDGEESPRDRRQASWQDWQQWQGKVRQLDSRWWPLWVFLGIIALAILLTFGLVIGVIFVIFRIITGILRAIFR